jgi:predicted DsbA family dithiol-disulfide isomerase
MIMMKIEIWSDIACPFCYIGKKKFETALEQFEGKDEVEVIYRSFELDPNAAVNQTQDAHDMLATKYGMTREKAQEMNRNVEQQAHAVGLPFDADGMKMTNTHNAHRLAHLANKHGKMGEMTERLYQAYFAESLHVGEASTLTKLAAEIGLDEAEVEGVLASDSYSQEVRSDEQEAAQLGIRGVPYFVIDRKYGISGAQPSETFLQALQKAQEENRSSQ